MERQRETKRPMVSTEVFARDPQTRERLGPRRNHVALRYAAQRSKSNAVVAKRDEDATGELPAGKEFIECHGAWQVQAGRRRPGSRCCSRPRRRGWRPANLMKVMA